MDPSILFRTPKKSSYRQLKNKVEKFQRERQANKKAQSKGRFGGKIHRLGYNERVDLDYGANFLYTGSLYFGESKQEM